MNSAITSIKVSTTHTKFLCTSSEFEKLLLKSVSHQIRVSAEFYDTLDISISNFLLLSKESSC